MPTFASLTACEVLSLLCVVAGKGRHVSLVMTVSGQVMPANDSPSNGSEKRFFSQKTVNKAGSRKPRRFSRLFVSFYQDSSPTDVGSIIHHYEEKK